MGEHTGSDVRFYSRDALGNTRAIVDGKGTVINTYAYKPYGEVVIGQIRNSSVDPRFLWVGSWGYRSTFQLWQTHYVRARHYSNPLGAWTTRDPLWPSEPGWRYVDGRVMSSADPTGLACSPPDPCKRCKKRYGTSFPLGCDLNFFITVTQLVAKYCKGTCPSLTPRDFMCQAFAESDCQSSGNDTGNNKGFFQISPNIWKSYGCDSLGPYDPGVRDPLKNAECAIKAICKSSTRAFKCSLSNWGTKTGAGSKFRCCKDCISGITV